MIKIVIKDIFLKFYDIEYYKKLHDLQNGLAFLSERMKMQQAYL